MKYLVLEGDYPRGGNIYGAGRRGVWGGITYGRPRLEVVPMECRGGDYTRGGLSTSMYSSQQESLLFTANYEINCSNLMNSAWSFSSDAATSTCRFIDPPTNAVLGLERFC